MSMSRFTSIFGKGLLVGILGVGLSMGVVLVAQADDDQYEVVVMSCIGIDDPNFSPVGRTFYLEDVSATEQSVSDWLREGFGQGPQQRKFCAEALKFLLTHGYELDRGFGAVAGHLSNFGGQVAPGSRAHIIYSLTGKFEVEDEEDDD